MFREVLEPNLCWGALRTMRMLLALQQVLRWKFRQVGSIFVHCVGKLGTSCYIALFHVQFVLFLLSQGLTMCQQMQK